VSVRAVVAVGRYLYRFFVGDLAQLVGLAVAMAVVALLRPLLGPWDGLLAFLLVGAVLSVDVVRRAAGRRTG